jgi:hypothetical protein
MDRMIQPRRFWESSRSDLTGFAHETSQIFVTYFALESTEGLDTTPYY